MKHAITHDLSPELAKKALVRALVSYQEKFREYNPSLNWSSENVADISFKVKGISLQGKAELAAQQIFLELDVPFLFKPFQKKAIDVIEREVNEWLAKAKRGELAT